MAASLIGCATAQPSQQSFELEAKNLAQSILLRMENDNELQIVSKKIWLGDTKNTPLSFYSIDEKVSSEEKRAIQQFEKLRSINFTEIESLIKKYNYPVLDLINLSNAANSSLVVDLYLGKVTYGQFAIKRKELWDFYNAAIIERSRQVAATQQVQRDAAFIGLQNYLVNQNLINSFNQPARINPFPQPIRCTSQYNQITRTTQTICN